MRSERGQATVEWIGILLLVALALAAFSRLAPHADDHALASTLARSITHPRAVEPASSQARTHSPPRTARAYTAPPLVPPARGPHAAPRLRLPDLRALLRARPGAPLQLPDTPALVRRVRSGAGAAWRRAWYACLVYERFRWAFLHPESRFPGYTMPPAEVLRILNDCISPVDLVRDWPTLRGRAGGP
jgi:hypothetical protein